MYSLKLNWAADNHSILFFLVRGRHRRCIFHFSDPLPILHTSSKMQLQTWSICRQNSSGPPDLRAVKDSVFSSFLHQDWKAFWLLVFSTSTFLCSVYFFVKVDAKKKKKKEKKVFSALNTFTFLASSVNSLHSLSSKCTDCKFELATPCAVQGRGGFLHFVTVLYILGSARYSSQILLTNCTYQAPFGIAGSTDFYIANWKSCALCSVSK